MNKSKPRKPSKPKKPAEFIITEFAIEDRSIKTLKQLINKFGTNIILKAAEGWDDYDNWGIRYFLYGQKTTTLSQEEIQTNNIRYQTQLNKYKQKLTRYKKELRVWEKWYNSPEQKKIRDKKQAKRDKIKKLERELKDLRNQKDDN